MYLDTIDSALFFYARPSISYINLLLHKMPKSRISVIGDCCLYKKHSIIVDDIHKTELQKSQIISSTRLKFMAPLYISSIKK